MRGYKALVAFQRQSLWAELPQSRELLALGPHRPLFLCCGAAAGDNPTAGGDSCDTKGGCPKTLEQPDIYNVLTLSTASKCSCRATGKQQQVLTWSCQGVRSFPADHSNLQQQQGPAWAG